VFDDASSCVKDAAVAPEHRTLSPSDFGFHNALRRPDGRLVFVDFEYFGWDDPVKLVCDFLWHPGMTLDETIGRRFADGARRIFAADPDFEPRLARNFALYGLRWSLIVLNDYLREAPPRPPQLDKARRLLARAAATQGRFPYGD
jgi:hypothetical protein